MCLIIWQSFEESAKARFIDDVFDTRRQWCPCTFQHLETTSTFETLQHKSLAYQFPWPKPTCPKNPHAPKKVNVPQQKINASPKCHQILPQPKFLTYPYTTTKFFHSHAKKKKKNPYMTKIKIPTSSCTKKFSHSQNHNHTNFPRINITYPTKFFHKSKFHTHKIFSVSTKFFHTHTHKILP